MTQRRVIERMATIGVLVICFLGARSTVVVSVPSL